MKFEELQLKEELLKSIHRLGFSTPTEIQEKSIPVIMSGKDIVGKSQTGSGKTAAFGIPILNKLEPRQGVQAIILTPTRELCVQVYDNLKQIGQYMKFKTVCVYGGVGIGPQIDALKTADVVVGTPGRVLDHLERKTLILSNVKFFVLDEADKMLEMGFIDDVKKILKCTPQNKQALMFSATMPQQIKTIVNHHFKNPVYIAGREHVDTKLLKQVYYNVSNQEKFSLLVHLLKKEQGISLIFCSTRQEVDLVTTNLKNLGLKALAIHGGLSQSRRLHVVESFKKEQVKVLVATDVAARGLDIKNITHVFNYDLPQSPEDYIHRVGRTARAGESGDAITLLTQNDFGKFQSILANKNLKISKEQLPVFTQIPFDRRSTGSRRGNFSGNPRRGSNPEKSNFRPERKDSTFKRKSFDRDKARDDSRRYRAPKFGE